MNLMSNSIDETTMKEIKNISRITWTDIGEILEEYITIEAKLHYQHIITQNTTITDEEIKKEALHTLKTKYETQNKEQKGYKK
jgi:hypothetical protein